MDFPENVQVDYYLKIIQNTSVINKCRPLRGALGSDSW